MGKRKLIWIISLLIIFFSTTFCLWPLFFPKPLIAPNFVPQKIPKPTSHPPQTTLLAVGDIMLGRNVNKKMHDYQDFKYPFLKTASLTSSADIAFGNLESPFYNNCPVVGSGTFKFCADFGAMEGLLSSGFDVLSLENNHALNYGQEGKKQTVELLTKNNILPSDSNSVAIKQLSSETIGFISFDLTNLNDRDKLSITDRVKRNAGQVDILIVSLHWGAEYEKEPRPWQRQLAHQIIDGGAKLILGHHPHVTQPTEKYHDGLIFYSLGNFVFDQMWSEETKSGKVGKIIFEGKEIKSFAEIPVYIIDYSQPQIAQ